MVRWLLSGDSASHSVWSGGYSVVTQQATQYGWGATQWSLSKLISDNSVNYSVVAQQAQQLLSVAQISSSKLLNRGWN